MKKLASIALALLLLCGLTAVAEVPYYSVNGDVLAYDIDNDGALEQIQLTYSTEDGMGYVTLNVSKNGVLRDHRLLLSIDLISQPKPQSLIRLYPVKSFGTNLLFIETHATGAESIYSMWMLCDMQSDSIKWQGLVYDPGWTGSVALYEGNDPVDALVNQLYSSGFDSYNEQEYLDELNYRFKYFGISFGMASMPFDGWYSAAVVKDIIDGECALSLSHNDLSKSLNQSTASSSSSKTSGASASALYVTVTGKTVHFRGAPDVNSADLGILNKDMKLEYMGVTQYDSRGVAWHYVRHNYTYGWISSKYSSNPAVDKLLPASIQYKVETTASEHIRYAPDLNGKEAGTAKKGTTFTFLGEINVDDRGVAWFKISYSGGEAWLSSKYSVLK